MKMIPDISICLASVIFLISPFGLFGQITYNQSSSHLAQSDLVVDSEKYIVGNGDGFIINILGLSSMRFEAVINMHGDIFVPEVGVISLKDLTLDNAIQKIKNHFSRTLSRPVQQIYVALSRIKRVTVTISGSITSPGTYTLIGTERICDLIRHANNGTLPSHTAAAIRSIRLHRNGIIKTIDLWDFIYKGVSDANGYLNNGDELFIGFTEPVVTVAGGVPDQFSGLLPIKEGECLSSFLSYLPFSNEADTSFIILQRRPSLNSELSAVRLSSDAFNEFILQNNDKIIIPQSSLSYKTRRIELCGAVKTAGIYSVTDPRTPVSKLLDVAGSFSGEADSSHIFIIRKSRNLPDKYNKIINSNDISVLADQSIARPEISASIRDLARTNDYLIHRVDTSDTTLILNDGDIIYVPIKDNFVYLSGKIRKPGAVRYSDDLSFGDYVKIAGGYSRFASRRNSFVISKYHTAIQIKDKKYIQPGDILVVPENQQAVFTRRLILPALTTAATIITAIVAVLQFGTNR